MDPYLYPNTPVLKNRRDLRNAEDLQRFENNVSFFRSIELEHRPIVGRFDTAHLCAIHRHLFGDVYDWAGSLRTVDISKEESLFARQKFVKPMLDQTFSGLRSEALLAGLDADSLVHRLAHYLGEVNAIHPFREGNGRAQREFFRELALVRGYHLDWRLISESEMVEASRESMLRGNAGLEVLLRRVIRPIDAY